MTAPLVLTAHDLPARDSLRGQAAIVTGAAQGWGAAIARAYAEAGMRLALIDIKADALAAFSERLAAETGASITPIQANLADEASTQAAGEQALAAVGTPRILVHNAALLINRPLMEVTLEAWRREMNIIIGAAFQLTQAVWEPMTAAGGGNIVYITSRSGIEGFLDESPYVAGKHALEGFSKCMAMEGEARAIRTNTLTPGMAMHTPMSEISYSDELKQTWIDPYLLTPALVWLAANTAISGQRLNAWELSEMLRGNAG